jgi:rhodanese-related sulfurtransferase
MKIITLLSLITIGLIGLIGLTSFKPTQKKYVCLPCGRECDASVHSNAGSCSVCGMELIDAESIKFSNIDFQELCKRIATNKHLVILDVRSPGEFNNTVGAKQSFGKFRNAINVNIDELENRMGELEKYKNSELIVYCSHSHRSPQASYYLSTHGFANVENVKGGVSTLNDPSDLACLKDAYIPFVK